MTFDEMIASVTPEVYERLQRAVELGKWADGTRLSPEQREKCMQAVIAYGEKMLSEDQRVGFIDRGPKQEGEVCGDDEHKHDEPQPLKIRH